MTNPGPVQPPSPQAQARAAAAAAEALEAKIIKISAELRQLDEQLRLSGEVTARSPDGTVRIHTPEGDIEIRIPPGQPAPRVGERVQVEIQPGDPPQTARVTREAPEESGETPTRGTQTPVDVQVRGERPVPETAPRYYPDPARAARPDTPPAPVPGQTVELEALPYPGVSADPLETLVSVITEAPGMQAQIAVKAVEAEITRNLNLVTQRPEKTEIAVTVTAPTPQQPPFAAPAATPAEAPQIIPKPFFTLSPPPPAFSPAPLTAAHTVILSAGDEPPLLSEAATAPAKFTARIAAILPPQPDIAAIDARPLILQNHKAGALEGKVVGMTPEKFPVIAFPSVSGDMPDALFVMRIPSPGLTPGMEISFTPELPMPAPGAAPVMTPVTPTPLSFLTPGPWPLMDEIYQALAQAMPQAAQAFSNMTPSPANPAQLGPAALFFIAAMNGGDLTQWLGDKGVEALRRVGRAGLISRLGAEGSALNRLSSEQVSGEWRALSLPMFWHGETQKIALYYRQDSSREKDEETGGKPVRFIFELNLDKMGDVQLDGLFRPRRLDLIVRTTQPLSQPMRMKMMQAYINALEPTEVRGELSFQNKPEQWVTIKASGRTYGASA